MQQLVESWINGNKSTVYKEYINLTITDKITFSEAMQEAHQIKSFNRYVRAIN